MNRMLIIVAVFLLMSATLAEARSQYIVLDLSGSSSFPDDEEFVNASIRQVAMEIAKLEEGDRVIVQTLGELSAKNLKVFHRRIDRRHPKANVAREVAMYLKSFTEREVPAQADTNLLGYFYLNKRNCESGDRIFLITDGQESSSLVNEREFVSGQTSLPPPKGPILAGCHVHMFGIGQQTEALSLESTLHIVEEWTKWTTEAGATFEYSAGVSDY